MWIRKVCKLRLNKLLKLIWALRIRPIWIKCCCLFRSISYIFWNIRKSNLRIKFWGYMGDEKCFDFYWHQISIFWTIAFVRYNIDYTNTIWNINLKFWFIIEKLSLNWMVSFKKEQVEFFAFLRPPRERGYKLQRQYMLDFIILSLLPRNCVSFQTSCFLMWSERRNVINNVFHNFFIKITYHLTAAYHTNIYIRSILQLVKRFQWIINNQCRFIAYWYPRPLNINSYNFSNALEFVLSY